MACARWWHSIRCHRLAQISSPKRPTPVGRFSFVITVSPSHLKQALTGALPDLSCTRSVRPAHTLHPSLETSGIRTYGGTINNSPPVTASAALSLRAVCLEHRRAIKRPVQTSHRRKDKRGQRPLSDFEQASDGQKFFPIDNMNKVLSKVLFCFLTNVPRLPSPSP